MKKKLLSWLLVLALLVSSASILAACNEEVNTETGSETVTESESVASEESDSESGADNTDSNEESSSASETGSEIDSETPSESESNDESDSESESASETVSDDTSDTESETAPAVIEDLYENGDSIQGAGTQWDDEVFALTDNNIDESKAVDISAKDLIALLADKESEVLKEGDVYRVKEPIVLESDNKYFGNLAGIIAEGGIVIKNVEEIVIKELVVKGEIKIEGSTGITLFKVDIKGGSTGLKIDAKSSDIALKNCKIYASGIAIDNNADSLSVYRGYLSANMGIVSTGHYLAVQDTQIVAVTNGISAIGEGTIIKNNLIELASDGVGVELTKGAENTLVALNVIKDAQISVKVTSGFNCVVLLNSAIRVVGEDCTNLYVVENKLGGAIELTNNKYLLCDGNTFSKDDKNHPVVNTGNTEFNGDNIQNVASRAEYGADEDLLPHTNKDLFLELEREDGSVRMQRHGKVRDVSLTKSYTYNNYVRTMGRKSNVVIVPPGAYTVSDELTIDSTHSNTTFYAYGVYQEKDSLLPILSLSSGSNITVKGLTVGYTFQSSGQVYVLEKLEDDQKLRVITNAGYINDFGKSNTDIFNNGMCDAFAEDSITPWISSMSYSFVEKCADGTMILKFTGNAKQYATIGIGDVFACRLAGDNSRTVYVAGQNNKLKDFVLYGYSAALAIVSSGRGTTNCGVERLHNTVHSGPVIDKETYDRYIELENIYGADLEVYIDEEGRYRGGLPRVGSVDATHITGAQQGFSATSCLFESMCDDGSNQRGGSSRLAGYKVNDDGKTVTLYFKGTLSETYWGIHKRDHYTSPSPTMTSIPQAGDKILVYASNGHIAFEGNALTDAVKLTKYPDFHVAHYDKDGDCICDDDSCKAHMHYDLGSTSNANRDGLCDICQTKVYVDMNRDNTCDVHRESLTDADGDGYNDAGNVPIIVDETQHEVFDPGSAKLTYSTYFTDGSGKHLLNYTTYIYEVNVSKDLFDPDALNGYDLTDNDYRMSQKILFDNHTMNSAGFVFDNVLIQHTRSRGILVKTVDATITNCTFRDHGMTSVLLSVETTWGESTVPSNILVQSCLFDNTGCLQGNETNFTQAPIAIQGLGNLSGSVKISESTLPCKNVQIIGNKFINTNNNYCITISAAQGITIRDNVFTARDGDNSKQFGKAVYIDGAMNITISDNSYESEFFKDDITKAVIGWNYKGLSGSDVKDKLPTEKGAKPTT